MERRFFVADNPFTPSTNALAIVYGDGIRVIFLDDTSSVRSDRRQDAAHRAWHAILAAVTTGRWCEISEEEAMEQFHIPEAPVPDQPRTTVDAW